MSSKSSIFLSDHNEHWYHEHADGSYVLEFDKAHGRESDGDGGLIITVRPGSPLWREIHAIDHTANKPYTECKICPNGKRETP